MTVSALASPLVAGPLPVDLRRVARDAKVPFPASMRDLLSRRPFSKTVRLQVVTVEAEPSLVTQRVMTAPLQVQLLRMRQLFSGADIGVDLVGASTWTGEQARRLSDLDIGIAWTQPTDPLPCFGTLTDSQEQLYAHRDGMAEHDVAIYRVRSIVPSFAGCATHPVGVPGAALADGSSEWVLAHEVGHVLGLRHPDSTMACLPSRLMTACGIAATGIPALIDSELDTMRSSPFLSDGS